MDSNKRHVRELKSVNINPEADPSSLADTPIEWYDFGGGNSVAPGVPETSNVGDSMAALACIRNGVYYFKVLEGNFGIEDLSDIFKEYAPIFSLEVEAQAQK